MRDESSRPLAPPAPRRLPLLEDPPHPGVFVVRRMGLLSLLLIGGLGAAMFLAGSLVHVRAPVQAEGSLQVDSVTLLQYVLHPLRDGTPPGSGERAP